MVGFFGKERFIVYHVESGRIIEGETSPKSAERIAKGFSNYYKKLEYVGREERDKDYYDWLEISKEERIEFYTFSKENPSKKNPTLAFFGIDKTRPKLLPAGKGE